MEGKSCVQKFSLPHVAQVYSVIDLRRWNYLFRCQLRSRVHLRVLANHHQDIRIQCVYPFCLPFSATNQDTIRHTDALLRTANALAQLLTVPPYAVAAVVMTTTSYFSDRIQSRGIFMAGASTVGGIGYMCVLSPVPCPMFYSLFPF